VKRPTTGYVELHAHSSHSLLDGVPAPEDLVAQAADYGMPALALTDHDGLYGAVRFVLAAREAGIKPILGAEVTLEDGSRLTLLVETRRGYANLCRLLTLAFQAALALGNARLYAREHRRAEELTAINRVARRISATLDLRETQDGVVEAAAELIPCVPAEIGLWDEAWPAGGCFR